MDAAGNVYITGVSARAYPNNWDIVTIKYNAAGVQQWMQTYDGPGNSTGADWDEGRDIAVDAQGYVYVTGFSVSSTDYDYITLRYTPQGALDWEQRYNGPDPGKVNGDLAYFLALDANYVYVTGTSIDINYQVGISTLVYTLQGAYVREMRYLGESVSGLVLDESGNLYIAGRTIYSATAYDFFTVKYNPDGTQAWAQTYDGPDSESDEVVGLAVDEDGNVYVTGAVQRIDEYSYTDIGTLKYSPGGDLLWDELYTGTNDSGAYAAAIAVDSAGNAYVGGSISGGVDGWDNGILKYDPDGNLLWERLYRVEGNESIYHLELDSAGNLYATGNSSTAQFDSSTAKFDPQGNMLWLYRSSGEMTAHDLVLDAAGYIYVTGESEENYSTIKYPPNPALFVSVADAMGYEGSYPEPYTDIQLEFFITLSQAVDYDTFLTYHTEDGTATAGSDYLAASGSVTIQAGWTGTSFKVTLKEDTLPDEGDEYFNVILDPVANARLTRGQVRGTIFEDDRDTQHWVARTTGGNENIYQNTAGLLVDDASNAYVVYRSSDSVQDTTLSKLVKYNSDGGFEWEQSYAGSAVDVLLVDDSFVYITGVTADSHAFLVKYTTAGAFLWEYLYDHVDYLDEGFSAITADPWGNILVLGEATPKSQLAARIPDFLLLKLTPDGGLTWERTHSGMAGSWDTPSGIGTDYLGGVYATGVSGSGDSGSVIKVFKYTSRGVSGLGYILCVPGAVGSVTAFKIHCRFRVGMFMLPRVFIMKGACGGLH